jgi:hypothetical protein
MQILTQRNVSVLGSLAAAWFAVHAAYPNLLPPKTEDYIGAFCVALGTVLASMGFTRTPTGNPLPPEVVTQVDRQATVARAGDAVVQAVAQKVTEEAKKPS